MKQVQENPWRTLGERYQVGARAFMVGSRNLTDFGAFIEIEDGVDGLVHVSDISWSRRIKHPGEILKKGTAGRRGNYGHRSRESTDVAVHQGPRA